MQENQYPSMQEILRMAQSPAGQQLLALLQAKGGQELQEAMSFAMAGDYTQAKLALSGLMQDPDAQRLLDSLGR